MILSNCQQHFGACKCSWYSAATKKRSSPGTSRSYATYCRSVSFSQWGPGDGKETDEAWTIIPPENKFCAWVPSYNTQRRESRADCWRSGSKECVKCSGALNLRALISPPLVCIHPFTSSWKKKRNMPYIYSPFLPTTSCLDSCLHRLDTRKGGKVGKANSDCLYFCLSSGSRHYTGLKLNYGRFKLSGKSFWLWSI